MRSFPGARPRRPSIRNGLQGGLPLNCSAHTTDASLPPGAVVLSWCRFRKDSHEFAGVAVRGSDPASWRQSSRRIQLLSWQFADSCIPSAIATDCMFVRFPARPTSYSHDSEKSSTSMAASGTCTVALAAECHHRGATTGSPRCSATPPETNGLSESCVRSGWQRDGHLGMSNQPLTRRAASAEDSHLLGEGC